MDTFTFYFLATVVVLFALNCILNSNPVYSALSLAGTMVGLAFVFFSLKAYFIAGVQLIVYAGAVMVLFVMVIMLFDLKKEILVFSKGKFTGLVKILMAGLLCGYVARTVLEVPSTKTISTNNEQLVEASTKGLAQILYTNYMFAFQLLGLLLLVIAVGAVAVSRIRGGTHAQS